MRGTFTQGQMFSSNLVLSKLEHVQYKAHLAQKWTIKNRVGTCLAEYYAVSTGASHLRSEFHKNHMGLLMSDWVQDELKCKVSGPSKATNTATTQWMMVLDETVAVTPAEGHEFGQCLQYTLENPSNKNEMLFGAGCCWSIEQAGFSIPFARG